MSAVLLLLFLPLQIVFVDFEVLPLFRQAMTDQRKYIFRIRGRLNFIGAVLIDEIEAAFRYAAELVHIRRTVVGQTL